MSSRTSNNDGLAFFGKVTAGQSHELTNVLNVINELAGLQRDLLAAAARGAPAGLERIEQIASRIQAQVERGETIIRAMNRFAHSVDVPRVLFDVGEVLGRALFLAERPTRLAETELVGELPEPSVVLEGNPFGLQLAVFSCIEAALSAAAERRRICVSYRVAGEGIEVRVESADPVPACAPVEDKLACARRALAELGGSLDVPAGEHRFLLAIPGRLERRPAQNDTGGR